MHDGSQQYGCNVPPMHLACTAVSLGACPHLAKVDERPLRCSEDESGWSRGRTLPAASRGSWRDCRRTPRSCSAAAGSMARRLPSGARGPCRMGRPLARPQSKQGPWITGGR
jgi:hypothetical protein